MASMRIIVAIDGSASLIGSVARNVMLASEASVLTVRDRLGGTVRA